MDRELRAGNREPTNIFKSPYYFSQVNLCIGNGAFFLKVADQLIAAFFLPFVLHFFFVVGHIAAFGVLLFIFTAVQVVAHIRRWPVALHLLVLFCVAASGIFHTIPFP
jgi:hypothetical protein